MLESASPRCTATGIPRTPRTAQQALLRWRAQEEEKRRDLAQSLDALYRHRKATLRFLRRCEAAKEIEVLQNALDPQPRRVVQAPSPSPGTRGLQRQPSVEASKPSCQPEGERLMAHRSAYPSTEIAPLLPVARRPTYGCSHVLAGCEPVTVQASRREQPPASRAFAFASGRPQRGPNTFH